MSTKLNIEHPVYDRADVPRSVSMASTAAKMRSSIDQPRELMVAARTSRPSVTLFSSSLPWSFMSSRQRSSLPIVSPRRRLSCFSSRILCSYHSSFFATSCVKHGELQFKQPYVLSSGINYAWALSYLHAYMHTIIIGHQLCTPKSLSTKLIRTSLSTLSRVE